MPRQNREPRGLALLRSRCSRRDVSGAERRLPVAAVAIVAVLAAACTSSGLTAPRRSAPETTPSFSAKLSGRVIGYRQVICVVNAGSNSVSFLNKEGKTLHSPVTVGNSPFAIAISANGAWAFVANTGWGVAPGDTVTPISLITFKAAKPIRVGEGPFAIAVSPDGKKAYVANMGSMAPSRSQLATHGYYFDDIVTDAYTVTPINLVTGNPGKDIYSGPGPGAVAFTPNGHWAYVANAGSTNNYAGTVSGTVVPINTSTDTTGKPIPVGPGPMAIAITPNGRWAYVANAGWWTHEGHTVTPIDLATNTTLPPIPVGAAPIAIAITPNGRWAYVANSGYGSDSTVTPINLATNVAGKPIPVGPGPVAIAISPRGHWAYVAVAGGLSTGPYDVVTPINLSTNQPGKPFTVGIAPGAIAVADVPELAPGQ